jgi:hypothetical protein
MMICIERNAMVGACISYCTAVHSSLKAQNAKAQDSMNCTHLVLITQICYFRVPQPEKISF